MAKQKKKAAGATKPAATGPAVVTPAQGEAGAHRRPGQPLVRTCVVFAVTLAALHAFTWLFALKGYIKWGYGTAHLVSAILNATGIPNAVDYNMIYLRNDTWNVTSECTAVNAVFLFISFVVAYASRIRSKLLGFVAGIPLILAVNILRLVALGWVTEYWPRQARLFHDYVWETVFVFFIIALWLVWINVVVNREKAAAVPC
jgi:archaeosortase B (VPXXXP-CTERM-specific)